MSRNNGGIATVRSLGINKLLAAGPWLGIRCLVFGACSPGGANGDLTKINQEIKAAIKREITLKLSNLEQTTH